MKIYLTGWNGFLSTKLRECTEVEWTKNQENSDILFLMGSPTFTSTELNQHDAHIMHQYVNETIKKVNQYNGRIVFASTTGVDDLRIDHKGTTCYNLSKLYLENYILNNVEKSLILRIGTIYSNNISDVKLMKQDRVQPRVVNGDIKDIPFEDYYLNVDVFIQTTVEAIKNNYFGILEYKLNKLRLTELKTIAK
jgi:hypothetical protein